MKIRIIANLFLILLTISCSSQSEKLENIKIDYYFEQVGQLEIDELIKQKVLIDSMTISPEYIDSTSKGLNDKGFEKYANIKADIYMSFFKDYLFMQKVEYENDLYVLYFTMAGFDDIEFNIFKWEKKDWNGTERLSTEKVKEDNSIQKILWNYDEGPKNIENVRVFIKNDYLVMERGNLYHSLYDLKAKKVLLNEVSPGHASNGKDKDEMNNWIKTNLHNKINKIINNAEE